MREEAGIAGSLYLDTPRNTVPNLLGVAYNARLLETVVREIAPAIGWERQR